MKWCPDLCVTFFLSVVLYVFGGIFFCVPHPFPKKKFSYFVFLSGVYFFVAFVLVSFVVLVDFLSCFQLLRGLAISRRS